MGSGRPDGETVHNEFSRSPSQRHRSRPRLQPPFANIDHPSNTTEDPSSGAFALWDDLTAHEIYQECTDPFGLYGPQPPAAATNTATVRQEPNYSIASWNTSRGWHKGWAHDVWWTSQVPQVAPPGVPWHVTQSPCNLQVQDPWRTPCAHNEQASRSLQTQVGNEKPSLLPPRLAGPCPERCVKTSSATSTKSDQSISRPRSGQTRRFLGLIFRSCTTIWTLAGTLSFMPERTKIFEDFSLADAFSFAGIGEQTVLYQSHMAAKSSAVAVFSQPAPTRPRTPQSWKFDRAANDLLSKQTRLSIVAEPWHIVALQESIEVLDDNGIKNHSLVAHFRGCATLFDKDKSELDLQVKSIYAPAEKKPLSGLGT